MNKTTLVIKGDKMKNISYEVPEAFKRILIKTPFEKLYNDIYRELVRIKYNEVKDLHNTKETKERLRHLLRLSYNLLVLKESKDVKISSSKNSCELLPTMRDILINKIEEEYKKEKLNYTPMTYEEGEDDLTQSCTNSWKDEYWEEYAYELGLTPEECSGGYDYNYVDEDMINNYIDCVDVEREISPYYIKIKIEEIENNLRRYKKKGAPKKNLKLYAALQVFIERGLQNRNKDFRIAFECLDYFKMIDELIKNGWTDTNKYPEIQYMKSLYREKDKYALFESPALPF